MMREKSWGDGTAPDLTAVRTDEELLAELLRASPGSANPERLRLLLAAWRDEVDSEPVPPLVETDMALAMIRGRSESGGRGLWGAVRAWFQRACEQGRR